MDTRNIHSRHLRQTRHHLNEELLTGYGKPQWIYAIHFFSHLLSPKTIQEAKTRYRITNRDTLAQHLAVHTNGQPTPLDATNNHQRGPSPPSPTKISTSPTLDPTITLNHHQAPTAPNNPSSTDSQPPTPPMEAINHHHPTAPTTNSTTNSPYPPSAPPAPHGQQQIKQQKHNNQNKHNTQTTNNNNKHNNKHKTTTNKTTRTLKNKQHKHM
jgi:hypothetical protein